VSSAPGPGVRCIVDTNVLVYAADSGSPLGEAAIDRLAELRRAGVELVLCDQVLHEYAAVVTRPGLLRRPRTAAQAAAEVDRLARHFPVLPPSPREREIWLRLLRQTTLAGVRLFDTVLAATALAAGVPAVLTHNARDFERFEGLAVWHLEPEA
jgi:predicted nucleic acid-binding protein